MRQPAANASPTTEPLQLLVVCPRGERLETVRELARQWSLPSQIHWTADPAEAVQRALAQPLALVIVDARLDRASGCALLRNLAQAGRRLEVMTFDEPGTPARLRPASTWHWSELPRAIGWWVQRKLSPVQRPSFR